MINEDLIKNFGIKLQMSGMVFSDPNNNTYVMLFPWEKYGNTVQEQMPTSEQWNKILRQLDLLEVEVLKEAPDGGLVKTVLRKSQRQIEQGVSWNVFRRDGYKCRYCGKDDVPLTVDHIVTWESGGPSIEDNLLSCCRKCNKMRGNMPYKEWIESEKYLKISEKLELFVQLANKNVIDTIPFIEKRINTRSR